MNTETSTRIKVDAHRDLLLTTILHAATHLSEVLDTFEFARRRQLRREMSKLLILARKLNDNEVASAKAEDDASAVLERVIKLAGDKFDAARFVEQNPS
jgi:hypothetical protein